MNSSSFEREVYEFGASVRKFVGVTGLSLSEVQFILLQRYYELLVKQNQTMNLTSIVKPVEAAIKHIVDTLMIHRYFPLDQVQKLVDVGTGAGIPGVILKIIYPGLEVVLLDSLLKRVRFLQSVIDDLGLTGISAWHLRAEEAGQSREWREQFPVVTARAVAKTSVLLEYCAPLCEVGGSIIAYKGPEYAKELAESSHALDVLGVSVEQVFAYELPERLGLRSLIVARKVAPTPEEYPRKAGIPAKRPL